MKKKNTEKKKKFEFSKLIIVFETFLVAFVSWEVLQCTRMCILCNYTGALTFLTTMITAVWSAYGVSVSFYYNKAKAENLPKIQATTEIEKEKAEKKYGRIPIDCDEI